MSFYVSTATFVLLHCDEWDRVVALPRHKFVTGATLLQLGLPEKGNGGNKFVTAMGKVGRWVMVLNFTFNNISVIPWRLKMYFAIKHENVMP